MNTEFDPKIGVGVFVMKEGKVLLGRRKSSHGAGEYATPGGHLEYMESFEDCAKRECMEEAGIEIDNVRFAFLYNMKKYAPKHYVHIELIADWKNGEPKVCEPDKCEGWDWYDLDHLPEPRFGTEDMMLEHFKTKQNYWDG